MAAFVRNSVVSVLLFAQMAGGVVLATDRSPAPPIKPILGVKSEEMLEEVTSGPKANQLFIFAGHEDQYFVWTPRHRFLIKPSSQYPGGIPFDAMEASEDFLLAGTDAGKKSNPGLQELKHFIHFYSAKVSLARFELKPDVLKNFESDLLTKKVPRLTAFDPRALFAEHPAPLPFFLKTPSPTAAIWRGTLIGTGLVTLAFAGLDAAFAISPVPYGAPIIAFSLGLLGGRLSESTAPTADGPVSISTADHIHFKRALLFSSLTACAAGLVSLAIPR